MSKGLDTGSETDSPYTCTTYFTIAKILRNIF